MKNTYSLRYVLITLLFFITFGASAQTFNAGPVLGFNATQVSGDNIVGFNKVGFNVGATVEMTFQKVPLMLRADLLFVQKGSTASFGAIGDSSGSGGGVTPYALTLNYIEIPVVCDYLYKNTFGAGLGFSLGKLVGGHEIYNGLEYPITINPAGADPYDGDYQPWDVGFILDALYLFGHQHWMLNFRWEYSLRYIAKNPPNNSSSLNNGVTSSNYYYGTTGQSLYPTSPSHLYNNGEFNNVLTLRIIYLFGNAQK
jgi:hypothetical protein